MGLCVNTVRETVQITASVYKSILFSFPLGDLLYSLLHFISS